MDEEKAELQSPIITIKAKIDVVSEILEALTPSQLEIFKKTCFGHWLDVCVKKNNQLLIHTLLTCMFSGKPNDLLSFDVQGKRIHFRPQEFCLITGLRFGSNMNIKNWVKDLSDNPFRSRIFPDIEANISVKLSDVLKIFEKMRDKAQVLEDNDAVRICLLVLLQQAFLGHQPTHKVSDEMLKLVEDISNRWNIFPWGSYVWDYTFPQLRHALGKRKVFHEEKHARGEKVQYTMTGFVWAFMIWILEAVPATHRFGRKNPIEKIPRALAWESTNTFSWVRCCSLFDDNDLAPPLETLKPTKAERETDWWKASLDYFEGKDVEKDGISEKKRKRGSEPSVEQPTYDQLMKTVATLTQTVATLTQTVDARFNTLTHTVDTLTQTVSQLQSTIGTLESRLHVLEGGEIGVASDGGISYMSPGFSNTSHGPLHMSPATTVPQSLPLANRRTLRVIHTPARFKSPMKLYFRKGKMSTIPPLGFSMPKTKQLTRKEVINVSSQKTTEHTEIDLEFMKSEKSDKPKHDLPDLKKIKRLDKYPILMHFLKKKTNIYLDCIPKNVTCEPWFWEALYPGDDDVVRRFRDAGQLDALVSQLCDLNVGLQQLWTEEDYDDLCMHIGYGKTQVIHMYIVKDEINEDCEACRFRAIAESEGAVII